MFVAGICTLLKNHRQIGSGVVEAANKTLVTQRMKRSGMRWKTESGQAILTFRALQKSRRLKPAWDILMKTLSVSANDNFKPEIRALAA